MTRDDVMKQVEDYADGFVFDVDGIVDEIVGRWGLVDAGDIDPDEWTEIFERHALPEVGPMQA